MKSKVLQKEIVDEGRVRITNLQKKTANKVQKRLGNPTNPTWLAQRTKLASLGELSNFARQ